MRKCTRRIVEAFENRHRAAQGNSSTDGDTMYLFDNAIAQHRADGLYITLAGWNTVTTRERLSGLAGVSVSTRRGQALLNGMPWSGQWVRLAEWVNKQSK